MAKTLFQAEITKVEMIPPKDATEGTKLKVVLVGQAQEELVAELAHLMKTPWIMVWIEGLQGQLMPVENPVADRETGEILRSVAEAEAAFT